MQPFIFDEVKRIADCWHEEFPEYEINETGKEFDLEVLKWVTKFQTEARKWRKVLLNRYGCDLKRGRFLYKKRAIWSQIPAPETVFSSRANEMKTHPFYQALYNYAVLIEMLKRLGNPRPVENFHLPERLHSLRSCNHLAYSEMCKMGLRESIEVQTLTGGVIYYLSSHTEEVCLTFIEANPNGYSLLSGYAYSQISLRTNRRLNNLLLKKYGNPHSGLIEEIVPSVLEVLADFSKFPIAERMVASTTILNALPRGVAMKVERFLRQEMQSPLPTYLPASRYLDPAEELLKRETLRDAYSRLCNLSPSQRQAFWLDCEGFTDREISEGMNVSISTVRATLQAARKKLKIR